MLFTTTNSLITKKTPSIFKNDYYTYISPSILNLHKSVTPSPNKSLQTPFPPNLSLKSSKTIELREKYKYNYCLTTRDLLKE